MKDVDVFVIPCPGREQAVEAILATETGQKCAALKDTQGRVPAHLAAMSSRRDLVELLLPHSGLAPDVGLDAVMARGKASTPTQELQRFFFVEVYGMICEQWEEFAAVLEPQATTPDTAKHSIFCLQHFYLVALIRGRTGGLSEIPRITTSVELAFEF